MKKKNIAIAIISVIAVAALGIKGKSLLDKRKEEVANQATPKSRIPSISVTKAKKGELEDRKSYLAKVVSDKSVKLSTKLAGYIQKLYVEESWKVKKGDLLVKIDSIELRSSIEALEATLASQRGDFATRKKIHERNTKLFKVGGIPKEKLEISKAALNAKKAVVENTALKISQLKNQLRYLQIKAPFDGEIETVFLHEGDLAVTAKPILSISDMKKKILFSYASGDRSFIKEGQEIFIDDQKAGRVKTIYTVSKNALITAEATLSKELNLPSGANVNIEVMTKREKGCIVPQNTILHKKDGEFLMIYKDKRFEPLKVEIMMQRKDQILIKECPDSLIAYGSEVKLASLPVYRQVELTGADHE